MKSERCTAFETRSGAGAGQRTNHARNFQDGADVKKGDVLFTIDPKPYPAVLDQAQGQLAQAKSQLVLDQITLKRQQDLRAKEREFAAGFRHGAGHGEQR